MEIVFTCAPAPGMRYQSYFYPAVNSFESYFEEKGVPFLNYCRDDAFLNNRTDYADAVMDAHTARETEGELKALGFSAGQRKTMIDYACRLNRAYFSGDLRDAARWDADGSAAALWAASGTLRDYYMRTVTPDFGHDYRIWEWKNDKAE